MAVGEVNRSAGLPAPAGEGGRTTQETTQETVGVEVEKRVGFLAPEGKMDRPRGSRT